MDLITINFNYPLPGCNTPYQCDLVFLPSAMRSIRFFIRKPKTPSYASFAFWNISPAVKCGDTDLVHDGFHLLSFLCRPSMDQATFNIKQMINDQCDENRKVLLPCFRRLKMKGF